MSVCVPSERLRLPSAFIVVFVQLGSANVPNESSEYQQEPGLESVAVKFRSNDGEVRVLPLTGEETLRDGARVSMDETSAIAVPVLPEASANSNVKFPLPANVKVLLPLLLVTVTGSFGTSVAVTLPLVGVEGK